ncbi:MAG TPA: hypothetical protein VKE74_04435 [Gemmataceae bacterium]|nr:hypothetical protein [Gemmataceae bacterium]
MNDILVFEQTLRNGVFAAVGDVDADGFADLVVGGGPGGGPRVMILSGKDLSGGGAVNPGVIANYFAGDLTNRGGVRVATKNLDGDGRADLVVGEGDGGGTRVSRYLGRDLADGGNPVAAGAANAFPGFVGGVFVG